MNKQQEALKLALEALEETLRTLDDENAKPGGAISDTIWYSEHETLFDYIAAQITAIRNALADSALDRMAENAREIGLDYGPIVERVEDSIGMGNGAWDMVEPKELAKAFHEALAEQPAQQPVAMRYDFDGYGYKYIDAGSGSDWQTRIKDAEPVYASPQPAQQQEHITDGTPCWCNPVLDYKDPDTGAEVWIHKEPQ